MERRLRDLLPRREFTNVSSARSRHMSKIKGKGNRSTELRLRQALAGAGIRGWTQNDRRLKGCPDIVFGYAKLVLFVDGCFWHGCPTCGHLPNANGSFWRAKIEGNRDRDMRVTRSLRGRGYQVIRFWEHQLRMDLPQCVGLIRRQLEQRLT
jgi:DNA mismatch endonuclease (patch repair protein)